MGASMGRFFRRLLDLAVGDTDDVDMYARIIGNRTPERIRRKLAGTCTCS